MNDNKDYLDRMRREALFRSELVAPPGAAAWLSQLLQSCGREFGRGHREEALPLLLGVLCAELDNADSFEVSALFWGRSNTEQVRFRRLRTAAPEGEKE